MKITDLNTQVYLNRLKQTQKISQTDQKVTNNAIKKDEIQLSATSIDIAHYVDQAKNENTDQTDKVNRIKAEMEQGTYQLSSQKMAQAMIRQMED